MISQYFEKAKEAAAYLKNELGQAPKTAVILGSGLSAFAEELAEKKFLSTSSVPHGLPSTVAGHSGKIFSGKIGKASVAVLAGRVHGFEGHSPQQVVHIPRAMRLWGVERFVITNAVGSMNPKLKPGSLAFIKDQINFTLQSPLTGLETYGGDRFPDQSNLFDRDWRKKALGVAKKLKMPLKESIYVGVPGPAYETAAEIRMYRKMGGEIVGMSTVWETSALHQMAAKILGLSCVTNLCTGVSKNPLSHQEVIETTAKAGKSFTNLVKAILEMT